MIQKMTVVYLSDSGCADNKTLANAWSLSKRGGQCQSLPRDVQEAHATSNEKAEKELTVSTLQVFGDRHSDSVQVA